MTRRVRRTRHLYLAIEDRSSPDLAALLSGTARLANAPAVTALSLTAGAECRLSPADLSLLLAVPVETWLAEDELDDDARARVARLTDAGLLVVDPAEGHAAELRAADEAIDAAGWHPHAALLHTQSRWRGVGGEEVPLDEPLIRKTFDAFVEHFGPPPPSLYSRSDARSVVDLPTGLPDGPFWETLLRRRSTRSFDPSPLTVAELAVVLGATLGPQGFVRAHALVDAVGKTSPSGGALHPIEAYPLVLGVAGIDPGIYHYDTGRHALALLEPLEEPEARQLAVNFGAGQPWLGDAAVVCLLAARFDRTYWKYRRHVRAYAVVLMDAAHAAQTFQLACTALGLGALFTAAVNAADIDERLGLDGVSQGVLAACLCGHAGSGASPFEPDFEPFELRR